MQPRWAEITAIYGGVFDPPHLGHQEAVQGLLKNPGVREVWVLPSCSPPHKQAFATPFQRLEMTRIAMSYPQVKVDLSEISRPGTTYTYDTLCQIKQRNPQIAFVIGTDQLVQLPSWHRFPEILGLCHWIVLERKGHAESAQTHAFLAEWQVKASIHRVPTPAREISSSDIRRLLALGQDQAALSRVSPEVGAYLKMHRIYGTGSQ